MSVNRNGYWVVDRRWNKELRTYACSDLAGLEELIEHLTGRPVDSFETFQGLPTVPNIYITEGLHIYFGSWWRRWF